MSMDTYVKLMRKFLEWEWYKDANTMRVFVHLLLIAQYKEGSYKGIPLLRGQKTTSLLSISDSTGISVQSVRTALEHLKKTGEITIKPTNKFMLITIVKWDDYQIGDGELTSELTNNQQTTNKQLTTYNKDKKERKKETTTLHTNKLTYGEFGNVLLTQDDYDYLVTNYGKYNTDTQIEALDKWFGNNTKIRDKRKDHKLTVITFMQRAGIEKIPPKPVEHELKERLPTPEETIALRKMMWGNGSPSDLLIDVTKEIVRKRTV